MKKRFFIKKCTYIFLLILIFLREFGSRLLHILGTKSLESNEKNFRLRIPALTWNDLWLLLFRYSNFNK